MIHPLLIFGYGNVSRGDDALGPLMLDFVENHFDLTHIDLLTDFQLQIEHALDLEHRELILFVDACISCNKPFNFTEIEPFVDNSYSTHAMSPRFVLAVFKQIKKMPPPPSFLLAIQGESFELGEDLSEKARSNLQSAKVFIEQLLTNPNLAYWRQLAEIQNNRFLKLNRHARA